MKAALPSTRLRLAEDRASRLGLSIRTNGKSNVITIAGAALADAAQLPTRREFLDRIFSISTVDSVRLDPVNGAIRLSFATDGIGVPEALEALMVAMRAPTPRARPFQDEELIVTFLAMRSFTVWRREEALTLWKVDELDAGRFRLTHPFLQRQSIRDRVMDAVAAVAGVIRQSATVFRPESIDVVCAPHRVTAAVLLEVVEPALATGGIEPKPGDHLSVRQSLVATNLILAPISDFLFPPLKVLNALLVWVLNAEHMRPAVEGLREKKFNLELLYLSIGALTLISFHFFEAAVMYALLEMWPKISRRLRVEGSRDFLARYRRRPQRVSIERSGATLEIPWHQLPKGQEILLREGDTVPGDGKIVGGRAEVRETWITGAGGLAIKNPGDRIFASSEISVGEVRMRIESIGEQTHAARLAAWFDEALRRPPERDKAEELAEAMVLPVLAFTLASMGRGGIHMAKAVIRPDYVTGPAIAEELSDLLAMIQSAETGFYIGEPKSLDILAQAEVWVFDESAEWTAPIHDRAGFMKDLASRGVQEVVFLPKAPNSPGAKLARDLGLTLAHTTTSHDGKRAFILQRQFMGQRVVYFGNCTEEHEAATQADLAITVLGALEGPGNGAPIALLAPDFERCLLLHSLSQARSKSVTQAFTTSLSTNAAIVAAAIFFHFPVIGAVIATNLGTAASYFRWQQKLRSAL